MTSRKPPSQRNKEFTQHRITRALQSMSPGTEGGRVANAAKTSRKRIGTAHGSSSYQFVFDTFTVAVTPVYTYQVNNQPVDGSLLVAVNGSVLRETIDYTVDYLGREFTIISPTLHSGDHIETRYATR